ncbi:MAG TPA: glycosyltransferase [Solirubrobacterales bacterium]|nr:glycosyltransferase [Solirubrobacterales bacterium]
MSRAATALKRAPAAPAPEQEREHQPLVSASTKHWLKIGIVLACLAPVTVLIGLRVSKVSDEAVLTFYGLIVLLITTKVMFVAFTFYRDPAHRGGEVVSIKAPLVSCLVACKDDREVIARCVLSLLDQTYGNKELIVIDDGSTDGSYEILQELEREHDDAFTLLRNEEAQGKKKALVRGLEGAKGEYLVFTDSDCVIEEDAVEKMVQAFQRDPGLGAVSGDARALNADHNVLTRIQDTWYDGQFSIWKATESVFGSVSCVSGPLAGFRREAIWNYFPAWAADTFFGREFRFATDRQLTGYVLGQEWKGEKLKAEHADSPFVKEHYPEQRWRIGYVKSAKVWTNVPPTMRSLMRQQTRWKKSFIRNLAFSAGFYWRRGLAAAVLFYAHALLVIATPFMAFRHLVMLPLEGAWVLTALFVGGVALKGGIWAVAYKIQNPDCGRWIYRPLMSLMSTFLFSGLLVYSLVTIRRQIWVRG